MRLNSGVEINYCIREIWQIAGDAGASNEWRKVIELENLIFFVRSEAS